jgi:hypothetical protein
MIFPTTRLDSVSLVGFDTERELYVFDAIWN